MTGVQTCALPISFEIVFELVLIENRCRQTDIFAKKVPVQLCRVMGRKGRIESSEPLVQRADEPVRVAQNGIVFAQEMNLPQAGWIGVE